MPTAHAQYSQQGSKLVGTGTATVAQQGFSVALSSNGNTLLVGGPSDGDPGATWVFTRSGTTWSQQGSKLVGTGASYIQPQQGSAVALSADGNTAIVGAPSDGGGQSRVGAIWVFVRSSSTWTQQGNKLVASDANMSAELGYSVAVSADGNTALVGGAQESGTGAAWVFVRSGATWTQQGLKLVGSGTGLTGQGGSVALSGDGNTAVIGGHENNTATAWVFTRSGGVWSQQAKMAATATSPNTLNGHNVAISSDGNTALLGVPGNGGNAGATYVFVRSGATWTQQGSALVGTGATGFAGQGQSVALSSDGNIALIGGIHDANDTGAAWIFTRSGSTWTQQGNKLVGSGVGGFPRQGTSVSLSSDGSTAAIGGPADTSFAGAAWIFIPSPAGPTTLLSAVLPASRSVQVGNAATAFDTIINTGSNAGISCALSLGTQVSAGLGYQTTNPATNQLTGAANTPVNIPAGGSQSFVFSVTPTAAFGATDLTITASCANATAAPTVVGLNTLLLSASNTPVPDVVALAASTDPGYVDLPGNTGTGAFSVATVNVGSAANIIVTADTGSASLPVAIALCQTNAQAACTNPATPASSVSLSIAANATPTFSIFVTGSGAVANNPGVNRVFVRFKDSGGVTRGSTSVAVKTQ